MTYTKCQQMALKSFENFINDVKENKQGNFILDGYAGTGKTFLLKAFINILDKQRLTSSNICFTGKAATVLKEKTGRPSCTIHSMIYQWELISDWFDNSKELEQEFEQNKSVKEVLKSHCIIIDEYSMLDEEMINDLLSLNKILIWVGDTAQLPPIKAKKIDLKNILEFFGYAQLTEIVRQPGKNNPILHIAEKVRNGSTRFIDYNATDGTNSVQISKTPSFNLKNCADENTIVLCFKNDTRKSLNKRIRKILGYKSSIPEIGEKMIITKNSKRHNLFNGEIVNLYKTTNVGIQTLYGVRYFECQIIKTDEEWPRFIYVWADPFFDGNYYFDQKNYESEASENDFESFTKKRNKQDRYRFWSTLIHMDFGYAITVHKAQGSQWEKVIVLSNDYTKSDKAQWLYTAVTRARKELILRT